jgi:hypothetical protein
MSKKSAAKPSDSDRERSSDDKTKLLPDPSAPGFDLPTINRGFEPTYPPVFWRVTAASDMQPTLHLADNKTADYKSFLWTPTADDHLEYVARWQGKSGTTSIERIEGQIYRESAQIWYMMAYSFHQSGPLHALSDGRFPKFAYYMYWHVVDAGGVRVLWTGATYLLITKRKDDYGGHRRPQPLRSKTETPDTVFEQATTLVASFPNMFRAHPW